MSTTENNKAVIRRLFEEGTNRNNPDVADEVIADHHVSHHLPHANRGAKGYKEVHAMFLAAFPDIKVTIEDQIAEGDKVVTRGVFRATHQGEFMGVAATGKHVDAPFIDIWQMENGKAVANWVQMDTLAIMRQIGVPLPG
jgi:predicted ester cyclase